jgi:monolysocardiolipin acyltransferase
MLRRSLTFAKYAAGATFAASMTSAWYHRPIIADSDDGDDRGGSASSGEVGTTYFRAPSSPASSWSRDRAPILLDLARRVSIGVTTVAIRLLMTTYGRYEIVDDDNYRKFLEAVLGLGGGGGGGADGGWGGGDRRRRHRHRRGLVTVSNHRSLFDDPGIVSCLLPLPMAIQPRYNRWALCSQEYCFNGALPGLVHGYIGAGQVLPIRRGGGIDQGPLLDFGRHLARGEWCHVFPEGGVWQWDELGGRRLLPRGAVSVSSSDFGRGGGGANGEGGDSGDDNDDDGDGGGATLRIIPATARQRALPPSPLGKLKWGVGKLIAHAPVTPVVIPFAHRGMERLLPQDEDTGRTRFRDDALASVLPTVLGGDPDARLRVRVRFGEEIEFDDLIREHESRHGKLWKYSGEEVDDEAEGRRHDGEGRRQDGHRLHRESWRSSEEERVLYSKIVRRIEGRLDGITRETCRER